MLAATSSVSGVSTFLDRSGCLLNRQNFSRGFFRRRLSFAAVTFAAIHSRRRFHGSRSDDHIEFGSALGVIFISHDQRDHVWAFGGVDMLNGDAFSRFAVSEIPGIQGDR